MVGSLFKQQSSSVLFEQAESVFKDQRRMELNSSLRTSPTASNKVAHLRY